MLVEFSVANFRSILGRQSLGLSAHSKDTHLADNVAQAPELGEVLRSAVIYGPNAGGKSNFLRALQMLQYLVINSSVALQEGQPLPVTPFRLDPAAADKPSEFSIVFIADDDTRYEYFCALTPQRVESEWLVAYPKGRSQRWFERSYQRETKSYEWWFGPNFRAERAERKVWQDFTRSNALFISTAIQLNNEQLKPAFSWIARKLIVLTTGVNLNPFLSLELLRQPEGTKEILEFMQAADIGIERLEMREEDVSGPPIQGSVPGVSVQINFPTVPPGAPAPTPKVLKVLAWHKTNGTTESIPFDLADESDGTQKLFEFTGGWIRALTTGASLFVDELDRSLHPYITRFLVSLFHGPKNSNNAQLIFTTHDTTLLDSDLLRRDQIWFIEKDQEQSTQLYPLLEYRPRKDEALERGYLKGRYGAVPLVRALDS
jgi:uncharacterized protein